jgi:hypothetical protein
MKTKEEKKKYNKEYQLKMKKETRQMYARRYYEKNKEKINIRIKKYYELNKVKRKEIRYKYHLKSKFGITLKKYKEILENQKNCCGICGNSNEYNKNNMSLDHCHKTKMIRGILCHRCNMGIGYFKDDIELLEKAKNYLKKYELK